MANGSESYEYSCKFLVEYFAQTTTAWYEAYVVDFDMISKEAVLTFEDNWLPDQKCTLDKLRFPPPPDDPPVTILFPGESIEVYAPAAENERCGWWNGVFSKRKGDHFVVEYEGNYTDIYDAMHVRFPNSNNTLKENGYKIYKTVFKVPTDLHEVSQEEFAHDAFANSLNASTAAYNSKTRSLVILASSESSIKMSKMMYDMHFRNLRTKVTLQRKMQSDIPPFNGEVLHRGRSLGELSELVRHIDEQLQFKKQLQAELSCPLCCMRLNVPTLLAPCCQATVCQSCLEMSLKQLNYFKKCPLCHAFNPSSFIPNRIVDSVLLNLF